jgi:hypothetical protein
MFRNCTMTTLKLRRFWTKALLRLALPSLAVLFLVTACQPGATAKIDAQPAPTAPAQSASSQPPSETAPATVSASTAVAPQAPTAKFVAMHIKGGDGDSFTDSAGNVWQTDRGFDGGQTIARPDLEIANTKDPQIYRSERYLMDSFSWPVPNGKYVVKLHFAETFDGVTAPGERVFAFNVQGQEFNDFDVWKKAGGPLRAYVETVPVTVTNSLLKITFTPKVENPQINGIEVLPAQ